MTVSVTASIASKVQLSPSERKVIGFLSLGRETTTKILAESYYEDAVPHNGQIVITNVVRSLAKKTAARGCPYIIRRGKRNGPHPMTVKLEKKSG